LSASENPANPPLPKATHAAPRAPPKSNPPLPQGGSKGLLQFSSMLYMLLHVFACAW